MHRFFVCVFKFFWAILPRGQCWLRLSRIVSSQCVIIKRNHFFTVQNSQKHLHIPTKSLGSPCSRSLQIHFSRQELLLGWLKGSV